MLQLRVAMDKVQLEPRFFKGVLQTLINIDFHGNMSVTLEDLGQQLMATVESLTQEGASTFLT